MKKEVIALPTVPLHLFKKSKGEKELRHKLLTSKANLQVFICLKNSFLSRIKTTFCLLTRYCLGIFLISQQAITTTNLTLVTFCPREKTIGRTKPDSLAPQATALTTSHWLFRLDYFSSFSDQSCDQVFFHLYRRAKVLTMLLSCSFQVESKMSTYFMSTTFFNNLLSMSLTTMTTTIKKYSNQPNLENQLAK